MESDTTQTKREGTHRRGFERVVLYDVDDAYAPPERPVLDISVIGETTCLTLSKVGDDDSATGTKTTICVDTNSLAEALRAAIRADLLVAIPRKP